MSFTVFDDDDDDDEDHERITFYLNLQNVNDVKHLIMNIIIIFDVLLLHHAAAAVAA